MKKVMLVDDEILIRENIRDCIQWEKEGFIYCGDASDGEVALPMIEQLQPDILITDIKMPFMNGLELSTLVRKRMPHVKIIILSGHDEFEYARSALRIGIEDYCLKPFSSSDIIQLLHTVSAKIDAERYDLDRIEKLQLHATEKVITTKEKLLGDLCSGFISTSDAMHLAAELNLNLVSRYYTVMISDIRHRDSSLTPDSILVEQIESKLNRELSSQMDCLCFKLSRNEKIWILKAETVVQLDGAIAYFQSMITSSHSHTDLHQIFIGIGSMQERLQGIHSSYLEAMEDKYWRRLREQNRWSLQDATGGNLGQTIFLDRNRFIDFLKIGSPSEVVELVQQFADELRSMDWQSSFYGYYILNDLTLEVLQAAKNMYRNIQDQEQTLQQLQQSIKQVSSWDEACSYLVLLAEQFWQWRVGASDRYADMLFQVKDYILKNYDKDHLSLQDAAEHVLVSPSHLSKVFSQETGQTFIDYLTHTRINKAMELLQSTNAKSYEIAFLVGYNDAPYFSNLFKRITGMTTREFRRKGQPVDKLTELGGHSLERIHL
jgi:two-component system response regulator YesN